MAKEIILTPLAKSSLDNIIEYLKSEWGEKVTNDFLKRFEEVYNHISTNPGIYPIVNKSSKVQKCVLTKQNILFFREQAGIISILDIFDTRQNPEKLKGRF